MEFTKLVQQRYSVRAYKSDPLPDEVLHRVLEAARLAPTAANRQAFGLIVVHTEGRRDELGRVYGRPWLADAPIVIAACGIPADNWVRRDGRNYVDVDVAIVMDHLILAAANEGLGACWIGAFDPDAAREVFGLPDGVEPIALTPLGYPADEWRPKNRKDLAELVHYERW